MQIASSAGFDGGLGHTLHVGPGDLPATRIERRPQRLVAGAAGRPIVHMPCDFTASRWRRPRSHDFIHPTQSRLSLSGKRDIAAQLAAALHRKPGRAIPTVWQGRSLVSRRSYKRVRRQDRSVRLTGGSALMRSLKLRRTPHRKADASATLSRGVIVSAPAVIRWP